MRKLSDWWLRVSGGKFSLRGFDVLVLGIVALCFYGPIPSRTDGSSWVTTLVAPLFVYCVRMLSIALFGGLQDTTHLRQQAFWYALCLFLVVLPWLLKVALTHL